MSKERNKKKKLDSLNVGGLGGKSKKKEKVAKPQRLREVKKSSRELLPSEIKDYVQKYLPIVDIQNGVIETKDGRYVKIIEIEPINFTLRSDEEKLSIIGNFSSIFKLPSLIRFQFKAVTKQADSRRYIDILMKKAEKEDNANTKALARNYVNLINELGSNEALTRRFFMVFEYTSNTLFGEKPLTYMEIVNSLNSIKSNLAAYFKACGNSIIDYEKEGKSDTLQALEILYMLYNRRSSLNESVNQRYNKLLNDYMDAQGLIPGIDAEPPIPVQDIIAPRGLDFSSFDHVVMDGLYYSYLYITSDGYPSRTAMGWASMLTSMGNGIDIDIHVKKEDRAKIVEQISRKIRTNTTKFRSTQKTASDFEELRDSLTSAEFLKNAVQSGQDFFFFGIIITVSSNTYEMMVKKREAIKTNLKTMDITVSETPFECEKAFRATTLINQIDKSLFDKMKRNAPTDILASLSYFFTAFEIGDEDGVLLGVNHINNSLCVVDLFNSRIYKNANMVLIGTSGAGKTFTMQLLALRMRMTGIQVFILAPLKGHEFKRAAEAIGGTYIKLSTSSPDCINVMGIRKKQESEADIIDRILSGEDEDSILSKKVQQLSIFFKLLIKDMTQEQQVLLEKAILDAYKRKGITQDNKSLTIPGSDRYREMPVIGDVYEELEKYGDKMKVIRNILEQFVHGSARNMNRLTNVDLENKYVVIDISNLSEDLLPVGMFIALDYCWDKIMEDRTKKKAIFIDETWKLINTNALAANFVLEIFKIIRGYGGAAIAATQEMGDFYALEDGKYGKGIVNNSKTKIILNLEPEEIEVIRDPFSLSRNEAESIKNFNRGEALLSTNNNKVPIRIKASQKELELITTDRAELAMIAERAKAESLSKSGGSLSALAGNVQNLNTMSAEELKAFFENKNENDNKKGKYNYEEEV